MTDEVNLDQVMARRFDLDQEISLREAQFKESIAPLREELNLCETYIKSTMQQQGLSQLKTDAGMTYFTTKSSVSIVDWDAALAKIQADGLWHFLTKKVSTTAVKEYIEEHKAVPPGVKLEQYQDLSWRRGKA